MIGGIDIPKLTRNRGPFVVFHETDVTLCVWGGSVYLKRDGEHVLHQGKRMGSAAELLELMEQAAQGKLETYN